VGRRMEEYRAYIIGPDGHIINRVDIRCSDEEEARRIAKTAVDGHAVELWQADRFIERFEPKH
jgi:hypothetical protein